MDGFDWVLLVALLSFPCGSAVVIAIAFLRCRINVRGLVSDQTGANSPARWQLLFVSCAAALYYIATVAHSTDASMPEPPELLWSATLASNTIYLTGKGIRLGAFGSIISGLRSLWRAG